MSAIAPLEDRLAGMLGRRHCIAVGRGATALWLAMRVLGEERPDRHRVVLPATLCTSPVTVTELAGLTPVFCDVEPTTGNLDPAALQSLLDAEDGICCVIVAHLYGQPAEIESLGNICAGHDLPWIEDAAQAFGATIGDRPVGGFGHMSVVSFGHTKILDAGGGGALLTDDPDLAGRVRHLLAELPAKPLEYDAWSAEYRTGYYAIASAMGEQPHLRAKIGALGKMTPGLYNFSLDQDSANKILAGLDELETETAHRRSLAALYGEAMTGLGVDFLKGGEGGVPWRFNVTLPPSRRDNIADGLRAAGFDASAWYPAVPSLFGAADWQRQWPGAASIDRSILNLWVDRQTEPSRAKACCGALQQLLQDEFQESTDHANLS